RRFAVLSFGLELIGRGVVGPVRRLLRRVLPEESGELAARVGGELAAAFAARGDLRGKQNRVRRAVGEAGRDAGAARLNRLERRHVLVVIGLQSAIGERAQVRGVILHALQLVAGGTAVFPGAIDRDQHLGRVALAAGLLIRLVQGNLLYER